AATNRHRMIAVGLEPMRLGHEQVSRDARHRLEHPLVGHAPSSNLPVDHPRPLLLAPTGPLPIHLRGNGSHGHHHECEDGRGSTRSPHHASNCRTRGATFVPNNSMLVIILSCDRVPLLYFRSKRVRPSAFIVFAIFTATVSGAPTNSAPEATSCSNWSRPAGDQPRSRPMRFIMSR